MKKALLLITFTFLISRIVFYYAGIRFDLVILLNGGWQLIDSQLLQHNLLESLFYLHSQPPLFNLYTGIILKLFPNDYSLVLHFSFIMLGLIQSLAMYILMIKLNMSTKLSFILTILNIISPSSILYENWFFYSYPTMVFLGLAALFLSLFTLTKANRYAWFFFSLLALIVLTRSMFHLVWFMLITVVLMLFFKAQRKQIIFTAIVPFLLVFGWFAKNYLLFNSFSSSTWMGMNLSKITIAQLSDTDKEQLVTQGILSPLAKIPPFGPLEIYKTLVSTDNVKYRDIPVLRNLNPNQFGYFNLNQFGYIAVSKQYEKDAIAVIKHRFDAYLKGIGNAFQLYLEPSAQYFLLEKNRLTMQNYSDSGDYETLFIGTCLGSYSSINWFLVLLLAMSVVNVFFYYWNRSTSNASMTREQFIVVSFLVFNIIYVTIVGNLLEVGENMRFRFLIAPFLIIGFGLSLSHIITHLTQSCQTCLFRE